MIFQRIIILEFVWSLNRLSLIDVGDRFNRFCQPIYCCQRSGMSGLPVRNWSDTIRGTDFRSVFFFAQVRCTDFLTRFFWFGPWYWKSSCPVRKISTYQYWSVSVLILGPVRASLSQRNDWSLWEYNRLSSLLLYDCYMTVISLILLLYLDACYFGLYG